MSWLHIRDPIHGFIRLNELEKEIIQTFPFQRLRFVHQLGTTPWAYPSGVHTRFVHSLGVLQMASLVLERFRFLGIGINEEDENIFRIACLLHDIGHPPFSHVGEDMKLFEQGLDHEKMGERIIRETRLIEILNKINTNAIDRIIFIITGKGIPVTKFDTIFYSILTGQAGIDRMDYLLRDSYFLGVAYGKFDLPRLLETLCFNEEYNIFCEEGGIHALEQFILARYFMFTEVYFHKTRRILDYHLSRAINAFLIDKLQVPNFPTNAEEYLKLNDNEILSWIINQGNFREIFFNRKFFRKIRRDSGDHPTDGEIVIWEWLEDTLKREFSRDDFYFDRADKAPYKFEKPDESIRVFKKNTISLIERESKLVSLLTPINKRNVYASNDKREEISTFVEDFLRKRRA